MKSDNFFCIIEVDNTQFKILTLMQTCNSSSQYRDYNNEQYQWIKAKDDKNLTCPWCVFKPRSSTLQFPSITSVLTGTYPEHYETLTITYKGLLNITEPMEAGNKQKLITHLIFLCKTFPHRTDSKPHLFHFPLHSNSFQATFLLQPAE